MTRRTAQKAGLQCRQLRLLTSMTHHSERSALNQVKQNSKPAEQRLGNQVKVKVQPFIGLIFITNCEASACCLPLTYAVTCCHQSQEPAGKAE